MANAYVTPTMIAAEGLRVIHNDSAFLGRINKKYQKYFGRNGEKIGDTINIPTPPQYTIRSGPVANFQDANRTAIPLTIQPEVGVDLALADFDFTLKVNVDEFMDTYVRPGAQRLATYIDSAVATTIATQAGNVIGTPGTPPSTTQAAQKLFLDAGVALTNQGADRSVMNRMMVLSPSAESNTLSQLNLAFNHQQIIGEQYKTGEMGIALGWDFFSSPNMPTLTTGTFAGTGVVNGANQGLINAGATDNPNSRTTSLVTNGWTASSAIMKAGDTFTIAGVYAVNPDSKQLSYTSAGAQTLRQFTATTNVTADGSGNATIAISPAIVAGGAFQNVTARPAAGAAIVQVSGAPNTTYPTSVGFVNDAVTFASVPMMIPDGVDKAAMMEVDGVSIRYVRDWDPYNNRRLVRLDVCFGVAVLRPEWAVRVYAG